MLFVKMVGKGRIQRLGCLGSVADLSGLAVLGGLAPHLSRGRHFVLLGGVMGNANAIKELHTLILCVCTKDD